MPDVAFTTHWAPGRISSLAGSRLASLHWCVCVCVCVARCIANTQQIYRCAPSGDVEMTWTMRRRRQCTGEEEEEDLVLGWQLNLCRRRRRRCRRRRPRMLPLRDDTSDSMRTWCTGSSDIAAAKTNPVCCDHCYTTDWACLAESQPLCLFRLLLTDSSLIFVLMLLLLPLGGRLDFLDFVFCFCYIWSFHCWLNLTEYSCRIQIERFDINLFPVPVFEQETIERFLCIQTDCAMITATSMEYLVMKLFRY